MSLLRYLPAWFHAAADYAVGYLLIGAAIAVNGSDKAVGTGVVVGAVVLVVSALTRYPLGIVRVLPFKLHAVGDYLAVVLLLATPFALDFDHSDPWLSSIYLVTGVVLLGVSLITNYKYIPTHLASSKSRPVTNTH